MIGNDRQQLKEKSPAKSQELVDDAMDDSANDAFQILPVERVSTVFLGASKPQRILSHKLSRGKSAANSIIVQQAISRTELSQDRLSKVANLSAEECLGSEFQLSATKKSSLAINVRLSCTDEPLANWATRFPRPSSVPALPSVDLEDKDAISQAAKSNGSQEVSNNRGPGRMTVPRNNRHSIIAIPYSLPPFSTIPMPEPLHTIREKRRSSTIIGHKPEDYSRKSAFIVAPPRRNHDSVVLTEDLSSNAQSDSRLRIAIFLFIFGFMLPPLWLVGSLIPVPQAKEAPNQTGSGQRIVLWKLLNATMLAIAILAGLSIALVLMLKHTKLDV